jgi:hypothetical protein
MMNLNRLCRILVAGLVAAAGMAFVAPAGQCEAAGNTYYVAKNGSNGNPGTEGSPWLTIAYAASRLTAGDTVLVKGGTYNEFVTISRSGSSGSPITYKAYPGQSPIIDGTGLSEPQYQAGMITIDSASFITIDGFVLRNNPYYQGLFMWSTKGNTDIVLRNLQAYENQTSGICISAWHQALPIRNVLIDNVDVHHNFNGWKTENEAISLLNVVGFEIKNSRVHDNYKKEAVDIKTGCRDGSIHDCDISGSTTDVGIYVDGFDAAQDNIAVYNNRIHGNNDGIAFGCETGRYPQTNIRFYNNLIYNNTVGFAIFAYSAGSVDYAPKTFQLVNNVFWGNTTHAISIRQPASWQTNCAIRNNILVGSTVLLEYDDYANGGVAIDYNLFWSWTGSYYTANKYGGNYIKADPKLSYPSDGTFRAIAGSPAIDNGSSNQAPSVDIAGVSRPQGGGIDMGAYEYVPPAPTPTPTPTPTPPSYPAWDVNQDGSVNVLDLTAIGQRWAQTGAAGWVREDVNKDGTVNALDAVSVAQHWTS